jgi:pyruvate-formate lyase-activating enzyme
MKGRKMERREMEGREIKRSKMERREMEKGGALTGGQAACFAPFLIQCLQPPAHDVGSPDMRKDL